MSGRRALTRTSASAPTGFEAARVTEVWASGDRGGMRGSGYLLDGELILTAGHVVDAVGEHGCEARPLGAGEWVRGEVVWRGAECDAALIRVVRHVTGATGNTRLGRFGTDGRADVRAVGFPRAQAKDLGRLSIVDAEDVYGQVAPLTGIKTGTLSLHVAGSVPVGRPGAATALWRGMSGAALFSGPLLVGIVTLVAANFGADRLEAVSVETMAREPEFLAALTGAGDRPPLLEVVEDVDLTRGLIRPPHRPMPEQATAEALRAGAIGFLLEPEYGVVPFHGRAGELDEYAGWSECSPDVAVRLLTGPPGAGKTRFAAELCRHRQADGALAGFLDANGARHRFAQLAEVSSSLLVVIDEAQSRIDEIADLLGAVASAGRRRPARILLLAREAGEWWPEAIEERLGEHADGRVALAMATLRRLAPLDDGVEDRERSFRAATAAFAERLGERAEAPPPDLSPAAFGEVLFVHLAALSAIAGAATVSGTGEIADALLAFALRRESRYWTSTARSRQLELAQPVLEAAVAVATMTSASSQEEAASLLRALPDLADAPEQTVRRAARWLRELYPPPSTATTAPVADPGRSASGGWFRPLGPALLGETLIAKVLGSEHTPELAERLLSRVRSPVAVYRALSALNQTAREHPSAREALGHALAAKLPSIWEQAVTVAIETGDPIGQLLARALEAADDAELAVEMSTVLPLDSVALREVSLVAARRRLEASRAGPPSADRDMRVAAAANDLANRLGHVGAHQEALATIDEAVAINRRLASAVQGGVHPLAQLAASLSTESVCLRAVGRRREALAPVAESVAIYRELRERAPGAFGFELGAALANESNSLSDAGRERDSLASVDEAIRIFGDLIDDHPMIAAQRLAGLAHNRSASLSALGLDQEALTASRAAVAGFRGLTELNPDAFLPSLADTLNNHSSRLWTVRRTDEALTALAEAIRINRDLAAALPEAFARSLAGNLRNLSKRLLAVGRAQEAATAVRESVAIYRAAAARERGVVAAELAAALADQSGQLARSGRREAALEAIEEAVGIARALADGEPDEFSPDLADALSNVGGRLAELGRTEQALASITEAVAIDRRLATASPGTSEPRLAQALRNQAAALEMLGRNEEALEAIGEAAEIFRRHSGGDGKDVSAELAEVARTRAQLLHALARTGEAVQAIEQAVELFRACTQGHGEPSADGLARSLSQHALYLSELGEDERAAAEGADAIGILRRLVKGSPDPGLRFELAGALVNRSAALSRVGREPASLKAINEAVALLRELGDSHSYDLAMALMNRYSSLRTLGRDQQALSSVAEATVLLGQRSLAGDGRAGAEFAHSSHELASVYLAVREHTRGSPAGGRERTREEMAITAAANSVDIYRQLVDAGAPAFLPALSEALSTQLRLLGELDRPEQALTAAEQAVSALRALAANGDDALRMCLAGALNRHAQCLAAAGDRERAAGAVAEAVELDRARGRRALASPAADAAAADLAFSLHHSAQILGDLGRRDEALAAATEAVGIRRRLADPGVQASAIPLALSLRLRSELLSALGEMQDALSAAQEAVATLRGSQLADDDTIATSIAGALGREATCLGALGQHERAVEIAGEAVDLDRRRLARAAGAGKDTARTDLAISLRTSAELLSELGRPRAALAAVDEALAVIRPLAKGGVRTAIGLSAALRHEAERLGELAAAQAARAGS